MTKEKQLEIGTKVFIITNDCQIEEKEVLGLMQDENGVKYRLMKNGCDGKKREELFLKRSVADKVLHKFVSNLKFTIGDVCIYHNKKKGMKPCLARVMEIKYNASAPYSIHYLSGWSSPSHDYTTEDCLTKVNNDYIENFEDIVEITREMNNLEQQHMKLNSSLNKKFDVLQKELVKDFGRMKSWMNFRKAKFDDRFEIRSDDYYD